MKLYNGDSAIMLKELGTGTVDLTVTSPPYDNLRSYNGNIEQWSFDKFKCIADEVYRVTAPGGVLVWVVGDAVLNGRDFIGIELDDVYFATAKKRIMGVTKHEV